MTLINWKIKIEIELVDHLTEITCRSTLTQSECNSQVLPLRARIDLGAIVLSIPQSSSIIGASPSHCLVSNPGYS